MVLAFLPARTSAIILGLAACVGLAGCGGGETVQQALGYEQRGPDEMAVIKRPPLIVPPDFNLRPPRPGDADAGGGAASDAARETLIGPSSSLDSDAGLDNDAGEARAILTGSSSADDADDGGDVSDGQSLLVSRTDRTELDLEALAETRDENQVDRTFLRRLLAWTPADRPEADENGADQAAEPVTVQVVSRSQTVLEPETP